MSGVDTIRSIATSAPQLRQEARYFTLESFCTRPGNRWFRRTPGDHVCLGIIRRRKRRAHLLHNAKLCIEYKRIPNLVSKVSTAIIGDARNVAFKT